MKTAVVVSIAVFAVINFYYLVIEPRLNPERGNRGEHDD